MKCFLLQRNLTCDIFLIFFFCKSLIGYFTSASNQLYQDLFNLDFHFISRFHHFILLLTFTWSVCYLGMSIKKSFIMSLNVLYLQRNTHIGLVWLVKLCLARNHFDSSLGNVDFNDELNQYTVSVLQARILEWATVPLSRGSSWPRDHTQVTCIAGGFFTI